MSKIQMTVEKVKGEVVSVNGALIALSTIHSISPLYISGTIGHGDVFYSFLVKSSFSNGVGTEINSTSIEYYKYPPKEFDIVYMEEHEVFVNKKIELLVVRDELVQLWCNYLEGLNK